MPFPNYYSARIEDPSKFNSFAYDKNKLGSGIDVVYGIKSGISTIQSIRFDKDKFTMASAKSWLKDHSKFKYISFESVGRLDNCMGLLVKIYENLNLEKSKGHIKFIWNNTYEYYDRDGEVYLAPIHNPIMPDGYRSGRWECSRSHYEIFKAKGVYEHRK
jgi:hypothetical protein